jgi:hypothetical protein
MMAISKSIGEGGGEVGLDILRPTFSMRAQENTNIQLVILLPQ